MALKKSQGQGLAITIGLVAATLTALCCCGSVINSREEGDKSSPSPTVTTASTPTGVAASTTPSPTPSRTKTKPSATPVETEPTADVDTYYANCAAARRAGAAPIHRGEPGYSRKLDQDGDGVACE